MENALDTSAGFNISLNTSFIVLHQEVLEPPTKRKRTEVVVRKQRFTIGSTNGEKVIDMAKLYFLVY